MADNKKYYYLRLKENFFDDNAMKILESLPDGYLYSNILLKMYLASLQSDGRLMLNNIIPYNAQMIASITRHQTGTVEKALSIFEQLGLIEVLDNGAIYMLNIQNFIGKSTTEADRIREFRNRIESEKNCTNVQELSDKTTPEIELEKDIETEKERKKNDYQLVADMYNEICISFPSIRSLSDARKKAIKARLKSYTLDDFKLLFEKAEASSFLKGANDRNWSATFDWLIKDSNMAKVLDGNYDNKIVIKDSGKPSNKTAEQLDNFYSMASHWAEND